MLTVWDDLTEDTIAQLWAEAASRFRAGEPLTLPHSLAAAALEQQEQFTDDDPRTGQVQVYLDTLLPVDWASRSKEARMGWFAESTDIRDVGTMRRERVCVAEIWSECFARDGGALRRQDTGELRSIMRQMPGWREIEQKLRCGPYGVQRCFERVADTP